MDAAVDTDTYFEASGSFNQRYQVAIERPYEDAFDRSGAMHPYVFFSNLSGSAEVSIEEIDQEEGTPIEEAIDAGNNDNYIERLQEEIKSTFSISMEGLAEACGVKSTKTLYNWRKEERAIDRQKRGMSRLFELSIAARDWRDAGFVRPGNSLKEPLVKGSSLYGLLLSDTIDYEAIRFCGAKMSTARMDEFNVRDPFA